MEERESLIKTLGVTPENLLGYSYAGLLATLCIAIIRPQIVEDLRNSLGTLLSTLIVLGFGVGIYTFYFKILGELILYPFQHRLHAAWDRVRKLSGAKHSCDMAYLGYLGVRSLALQRAAYEDIKASFYEAEARRRIHLEHGELHILYLTAVEFAAFSLYLWIGDLWPTQRSQGLFFSVTAIVSYLGALLADTRQHSRETQMLKACGEPRIRDFLSAGGYISVSPSRNTP